MKVFVVCTMLFAAAMAAPGIMDTAKTSPQEAASVVSVFNNCAESDDLTTCLAIKGITALNRAARSSSLEILPGVAFVR